jgi:single-strand DNA-binding protein
MGNLTHKPEIRFTPNGKKYCYFTVAENYSVKDGDGWKEKVNFISAVAWEKLAENMAAHLDKGSGVYAEGKIIPYTKTLPDGKKDTRTHLTAKEVRFLGLKKDMPAAPQNDDFYNTEGNESFFENANEEAIGEDEEVPF